MTGREDEAMLTTDAFEEAEAGSSEGQSAEDATQAAHADAPEDASQATHADASEAASQTAAQAAPRTAARPAAPQAAAAAPAQDAWQSSLSYDAPEPVAPAAEKAPSGINSPAPGATSARPTLLSLTPTLLSHDDLRPYEEEFAHVFDNSDVRNIAIAGPYGAGKSTVVNSWKLVHTEHKYLTVSLAHFNRDSSRPSSKAIEEALINQLVYQLDLRKAPKTRFRNTTDSSRAIELGYAALWAVVIFLTCWLIWAAAQAPDARPSMPLFAVALIAWFASTIASFYHVVRTNALGKLLHRTKLANDEIQLAEGEGDSKFIRYMSDLVYVLNASDYDVVIFEDLDRFGSIELFEKLRELNVLANATRGNHRTPLRFMYLINDSVFDDAHDRTKFFDYIIPVIPYVDPTNALDLLRAGLAGVGISCDENFLYELSLFIDDPRILHDIVDEAHHYKEALFSGARAKDLDSERLVSIVAYKALFPRDFEMLQVGRGYVAAVLSSRANLVEELREDNARKIKQLNAELAQLKDSAHGNQDGAQQIQRQIDELQNASLQYSRKTLAQLLNAMPNAMTFFKNPPSDRPVERAYLSEVLGSYHFPLIQFLVMRGWLDDTHQRFMSNFYSDSMSIRDREFIMGIFQGRPLDAGYVVNDPQAVLLRLDAETLTWSNAKNFSLISYLIQHGPEEKLSAVFSGIRQDGSIELLLNYIESDQFNGAIFGVMEHYLENPIIDILADEHVDISRRRRFCHLLLVYGAEALERRNVREAARAFAESDSNFLDVEATSPASIVPGLVAIGYRTSNLDVERVDRGLLRYVFENNLFEPTAANVDSITSSLLDTAPSLASGFLVTRLYNFGDAPIKSAVYDNIDAFLNSMFDGLEGGIVDSTDAVAWVLNSPSLSKEVAQRYIDLLNMVVGKMGAIQNHDYQRQVLNRELMANTATNILDYFASSGYTVDDLLAAHLMKNPFPDDLTIVTTDDYLGGEHGFLRAIIESPNVSDDKLEEIASLYRAQFNRFDVAGIPDDRLRLLIESGVLRVTADNLNFVREHNPECAVDLAAHDCGEYVNLVVSADESVDTPCVFSTEEALALFSRRDVYDGDKIALLDGFPGTVSINKDYSDELNIHIVSEHFNKSDMKAVGEVYENGIRKLKRALAEAVAAHKSEVVRSGVKLPIVMVADVAWRMRNRRGDQVSFIASQLAGRDYDPSRLEVRTIFERCGLSEYVELIDGPSAVIPSSDDDDALISALAAIGMAGKQSGRVDWEGKRRINSKGFSRK